MRVCGRGLLFPFPCRVPASSRVTPRSRSRARAVASSSSSAATTAPRAGTGPERRDRIRGEKVGTTYVRLAPCSPRGPQRTACERRLPASLRVAACDVMRTYVRERRLARSAAYVCRSSRLRDDVRATRVRLLCMHCVARDPPISSLMLCVVAQENMQALFSRQNMPMHVCQYIRLCSCAANLPSKRYCKVLSSSK